MNPDTPVYEMTPAEEAEVARLRAMIEAKDRDMDAWEVADYAIRYRLFRDLSFVDYLTILHERYASAKEAWMLEKDRLQCRIIAIENGNQRIWNAPSYDPFKEEGE